MASLNLVTWNAAKNANARQQSSSAVVDFQSVRIGASQLAISESSGNFDFNNKRLGGISDASSTSDAVSLGQMNAAISLAVLTGGSLKEAVLVSEQLSAAQGIKAASVFFCTSAAAINDTVVLKSDTVTETWTFAGTDAAFSPDKGSTPADSMENLANRINIDSTEWSAKWVPASLVSINAGGCVVIYEKNTFSGASVSRIYGTWATQANAKRVDYSAATEYKTAYPPATLPTADGAAVFGFRRQTGALANGEIHYIHETDVMQSWDEDSNSWTTFQNGSVPDGTSASGGGVKGKFSADSDFGLQATAGVLRVVTDNQAIGFNTGALALILDGSSMSQSASGLKVADSGITEDHINASAVGNGLTGGGGTAISVGAGDGIEVVGSAVNVNYTETLQNDYVSALTLGQAVFVNSSGNVDILASTTSGIQNMKVGIVAQASIASAASGKIFVRAGAKMAGFSGLTPGEVFVGQTPGSLTQDTSGFTTGDHVFRVGHAINSTTIVFDPEHKIEL